jgi:HD-like signal output (HDOD) protein
MSGLKKQILFVDDEPRLLSGLRRMLRSLRDEWDMEFVASGREALERLASVRFDVVVSDMRMPGMDGSQLLDEVMRRYPDTVRIILSGQCDRQAVLKAVGPAHLFLAKPCDAQTLKSTVAHACELRDGLADVRHKNLVSRLQTVPSLPSVYRDLREELQSSQTSVERAGALISADIGMTSKVLQLVSSGFLGLPRRVSHPAEAAKLLGLDTLRPMVFSTGAFRPLQAEGLHCWLEALTQHSLAVARTARKIAQTQTGNARLAGDAFLAGMLHDVGMLVLAEHDPQCYLDILAASRAEGRPVWAVEQEKLGITHGEIGAYLMALWGLPDAVVEGVALHDQPGKCSQRGFSALTAVHVAGAIVQQETGNQLGDAGRIDTEYLGSITTSGADLASLDALTQ